jgi:phosphatidate cytidylyltransferase
MRQRSISAVGVIIIGLMPAFFGGPIFAVVLTTLCAIGLLEYNAMARRIGNDIVPTGFIALPAFALAAGFDGNEQALLGACAIAAGAPLIWAIFRPDLDRAFIDWALTAAGTLYLGLPLFAAIALRQSPGTVDANWLEDLTDWLSPGWDAHPRGLAWLLLVILVTWLGDTFAYLGGRTFGKHALIPRISPKKTIEGFVSGLAGSAATGAIAVALFGLGIPWWAGMLAGVAIGALGVVGDLAESLLKRQVEIKDSGTLIPGHGGLLDRVDALLFTWVAGLYVATLLDRWFL